MPKGIFLRPKSNTLGNGNGSGNCKRAHIVYTLFLPNAYLRACGVYTLFLTATVTVTERIGLGPQTSKRVTCLLFYTLTRSFAC